MPWLPLALLTAAAFALYNVFLKLASDRIDQILGAFVLQAVAAGLGAVALAVLKASGREIAVSAPGLRYAALAGLCVGAAEVLAFLVFARGAPVSVGTPIIMGGSVLFGALLGVAVLREGLAWAEWIGVALIVAGVGLLSASRG